MAADLQRSASLSSHASTANPPESAQHQSDAKGSTSHVPENDITSKMSRAGLRVAPPDSLPSPPPLTPRDYDPGLDRANLRDSWAEDDLGTTSSNAVSPEDAFYTSFGEPSQPRRSTEHPLGPISIPNGQPEPPLWEPPRHSQGQGNCSGSSNTRLVHDFSSTKPLRSRPLIPHSSYYFGPPPPDAAYGSSPVGQIGKHHPREIVRIERDYSGGELPQFASSYPLEFEGRLTPTQFLETINSINELLISAYDLNHSLVDNALAFFTLQLSRLIAASHYDKEMRRLQQLIEDTNVRLFNPAGLHIRWPRKVAFMFLEIEYY